MVYLVKQGVLDLSTDEIQEDQLSSVKLRDKVSLSFPHVAQNSPKLWILCKLLLQDLFKKPETHFTLEDVSPIYTVQTVRSYDSALLLNNFPTFADTNKLVE